MKFGRSEQIEYGILDWAESNRKKNKKHVQNLTESYQFHGMLRPFICTRKDKNGKHILLDASHGHASCEGLISKDELVPCYVIDWIDPDNITDVKKTIMLLNKNRKNWSIIDYIISHSLDLDGIYTTMSNTWKDYKKTKLTMGTVVASFSRDSREHNAIRDGKFIYDVTRDKPFTDDILKTLSSIMGSMNQKNKASIPNNFAREIVECIWGSIEGWNYDTKRFESLLKQLRISFKNGISNNSIPANKDMIREWYKNIAIEIV
jgi:hypothetical protein